MTSNKARLRLCAATALASSFALPGAALAQVAEDSAAAAETIVVTGSRIRSDGMAAPVPVTVATASELETLSPGALISGVSQLPQFVGNQTPNSGNFFTRAGQGALNLRGLGTNRTLTLLNGRRVTSATSFGGVDVNLFPEAVIRSVETTTGGASAAYGSDAVAGVVNFTLDTDFTGLEASLQGGITDRGDGENGEASLTYGTAFGAGRGHLLVSGEYFSHEGIQSYEGRDWYQAWGTLGSGTEANPYRFSPGVVSANASFDGRIYAPGTAINGLVFDRDGNISAFTPGSFTQGAVGTAAARTVGGGNDDLGSERTTLYPDLERYALFGYADYDLTEDLKVFAQYIHGSTNTFGWNTPRGGLSGSPTALTIFSGNAYLPDALQQLMTANNIASFTLRRVGSIEDIGQSYLDDTTTQHMGTAGFEFSVNNGGFMDGWNIDGFYQYGHSRRTWKQNGLRVDRIFAAADAVDEGLATTGVANGNIVCRVSLDPEGAAAFPGCEPINLFGRGNASAEAVDYVVGFEPGQQITTPVFFASDGFASGAEYSYTTSAEKVNVTTFQQHYAEVAAAGDLVDLWAGPLSGAFGGSYRRDEVLQLVQDPSNPSSNHTLPFAERVDPEGDPLPRPVLCNDPALGLRGVSGADCGNTVGLQFSKVSNIKGSSTVWEAFGELLLPLYDSEGFAAVANGAVRWADYSGSGSVWAYKGGLELAFADEQLRLRGTYSRDVRAPNLSERFDKTGGTAVIDDPRTANVVEAITVTRFSGGNPDVQPEEADTWTVGAVVRPDFIPGLSMSVDYYNIKLAGAISQVGNQAVLDRCFKQDAQEFCDLITLSGGAATPDATGDIVLVGDVFVNVAEAAVEGVDFETSYLTDVSLLGGEESLGLRFFAAWLLERSETNANGDKTDFTGQVGATQGSQVYLPYADFRATGSLVYNNGGFSALLQARHIGAGLQDACGEPGACPAASRVYLQDNSVEAVTYLDLRLGYEFELSGAEVEVYGNITNLGDTAPPVTPSYSAFTGQSTQHNASVYDLLGRRYTLGLKVRI